MRLITSRDDLFSVKRQDLLGAEGQHGSVAAGNNSMLLALCLRTQAQIPCNFAQRYHPRHSLPRRRSLGTGSRSRRCREKSDNHKGHRGFTEGPTTEGIFVILRVLCRDWSSLLSRFTHPRKPGAPTASPATTFQRLQLLRRANARQNFLLAPSRLLRAPA